MVENPNCTWPDLKKELSARFAAVTDRSHAFCLLRKIRQKEQENVHLFAERIILLSEEAYSSRQGEEIERQLVSFFIDGLKSDSLRLRLMRQNPAKLNDAVQIAMSEQNLQKRFELRSVSHRAQTR